MLRDTQRDHEWTRGALVVGVVTLTALMAGGLGPRALAGASEASRAAAPQSGQWSAPVRLFQGQGGASLRAISCASAHLCVAVGAKGSGLSATGVGLSGATAWSSPVVIDNDGGLTAASCAPQGTCVGVGAGYGDEGDTYGFVGGKWSAGPTSVVSLDSVSCPKANFCAAVGFLNYASAFVFNGKSWSSQIPINAQGASISCPTTTFCAVVSESGKVLYYKDGTWAKATSIDPNRGFSSISCTSATFCVAVDSSGNALTDVNGSWSKPDYATPLDASASLTGVSCPSTKFCVAVDSDGRAFYDTRGRWSSPHTISGQIYFTSVSCPTMNFCAAAGQSSFTSSTAAYITTYSSLP